ncbi:MAG: DJ-1/PfpI family protein [Thermodesulfobacteriota bacterium]|nr:DJ-1/PfpI family protein [Thermodesulfobacteriota bacterium]
MNRLKIGRIAKFFFSLILIFLILDVHLSFSRPVQDNKGKAVLIIANSNFRDEELFETKDVIEDSGVTVTVASDSLKTAEGMLGGETKPDITIETVEVEDYDIVVFVGGRGATIYLDDLLAHRIAKKAVSGNKVLGAICIAPLILANAGVIKEKRVTSWPGVCEKIIEKGANCTGNSVEIDGNIVTANGPKAAKAFGEALLKVFFKTEN